MLVRVDAGAGAGASAGDGVDLDASRFGKTAESLCLLHPTSHLQAYGFRNCN